MNTDYERGLISQIQDLDIEEIKKLRQLRTQLKKVGSCQYNDKDLAEYLTVSLDMPVTRSQALIAAAAEGATICERSENQLRNITFREVSEDKKRNLKNGNNGLLQQFAKATAERQRKYADHVLNFCQLMREEKALYQAVAIGEKSISAIVSAKKSSTKSQAFINDYICIDYALNNIENELLTSHQGDGLAEDPAKITAK